MSGLSPYAAEFVQGKAYVGKLNDPTKDMVEKLTDSVSKMKVATSKPSRPKSGRAYDVSLETMLIESALSRIQQQPLPVTTPETSNPRTERSPRKKKFIRPSDANKKLSKLKKSVVNYREEQERATRCNGDEIIPEQLQPSDTEISTCDQSNQVGTQPTSDAAAAGSDESATETSAEGSRAILSAGSSSEAPVASLDLVPSNESQTGGDESDNGIKPLRVSTSPGFLSTTEANSRKQPLKRTPTMDRLKANLQGEALKEVEQLATELIIGLKRFQDRLYNKDEVKARMRQRMYYGLKESMKFMQGQKVKMIIMARDLEAGPGGLDELIENLLTKARVHRVPVVIALSRNKLKRLSQKPSKVACIAITDPSGRDEQFTKILEIVKPLGVLESLEDAALLAAAEDQERKPQQDLENWTSTTRRGRFEFPVDKLFPA